MTYLDTHVVVWLYAGMTERLPPSMHQRLNASDLYISPMVMLELQYLYEIGRTTEPGSVVVLDLSQRLGLRISEEPFHRIIALALPPLRKGHYSRFTSGLWRGVWGVPLECGSCAPALGGRSRAALPAWPQAAKAPAWLAHSKSVCPPCMLLSTVLLANLSATERESKILLTIFITQMRIVEIIERPHGPCARSSRLRKDTNEVCSA